MAKKQRTGPVALGIAAANIFQGGGGIASQRDVITHVRVTNETAVAAKFSLWIGGNGLSAAGTSIAKDQTVDANKSEDLYLDTPVESTEYLVGKADTAAALTVTVDRQREVI
jgi:hypothetical protein